ncbi:exodeoxyribonuclease VII large subunit [Gilliamella sp. Pra-s65]|uniref:exodeoxyribonuclease VII large subunit n=1 Tax=unclassified Gilliamella TaxID=2685620 RepID=UPI00136653C7|nr:MULTISPECIES: exodeoxyribonuclease VII large subunit [unclassified Gilliamella]MWN91115.1 exodeoxyribonuclease VII large subunit [Gilliamella sp. Pra-s65]MWP73941.1 exodeoxyribonuclease VII large subunit [Gilliamella sp. Pra-s52]
MQNSSVLSVKDLNQIVKDLLSDAIGQVWLVGEVSNFSRPSSGHWYFSLKDDSAQVRCAMFRNSNFRAGFTPQNGQQVLVRATVTLYEARGEYQLVIDKIQPAGAGLLQQKFEQLKKRLSDEGVFDAIYKKPLPENIRTVGIITSSTGAALHDICQILKRRDPSLHLIIYPTQVQGIEAAEQIAKMIQIANIRQECDVLIVGRGGGSIEDLWSFNEEIVARAIFASQLPIVSAVGHEIDFTIADFVADIRAATPSAAAELVSQDSLEQVKRLQVQQQHLSMAMDYYLIQSREKLNKWYHRLQTQHPQTKLAKQLNTLLTYRHTLYDNIQQYLLRQSNYYNQLDKRLSRVSPQNKIYHFQQLVSQKQQQIIHLVQQKLTQSQHQFVLQTSQLNSVSPLATLGRGYSVTTNQNNTVVRLPEEVAVGELIITKLKKGSIVSQVTQIDK